MEPTTLHRRAGMPPEEFGPQLRAALERSKLVLTTGVSPDDDPRAFWDVVSESIGECVLLAEDAQTGAKLGQKWMEIRYDPRFPNAYRHSKNAQPLHTDGSYLSAGPEIIFFYCLSQARSGGETTFIDSAELLGLLEKEDAGLLRDLRHTPVLFSKADDRKRRKIIDEDASGPTFNWNYFCVDRGEPADVKALVERFHSFLEKRVVGERQALPIRLEPGHAVFFHDERLLHGRNAFAAEETSERFFWKTGFTFPERQASRAQAPASLLGRP